MSKDFYYLVNWFCVVRQTDFLKDLFLGSPGYLFSKVGVGEGEPNFLNVA